MESTSHLALYNSTWKIEGNLLLSYSKTTSPLTIWNCLSWNPAFRAYTVMSLLVKMCVYQQTKQSCLFSNKINNMSFIFFQNEVCSLVQQLLVSNVLWHLLGQLIYERRHKAFLSFRFVSLYMWVIHFMDFLC